MPPEAASNTTTLRLVVDFADSDWTALRRAARRDVTRRIGRAFVPRARNRPADWSTFWDDETAVSRLQAVTRRVLDARIAQQRNTSTESSVTLIANALMPVAFAEQPLTDIERATTETSTRILLGVITLLATTGDRLRRCPECGRPFVRVRRQLYCDSKCTDRATWRNYPKEKKNRHRERQYAKHGWRLGARTPKRPSPKRGGRDQ